MPYLDADYCIYTSIALQSLELHLRFANNATIAIIPDGTIKALHIRILLWLAWLDMDDVDLMLGCPFHESGATSSGPLSARIMLGLPR